MQYDEVKTYTFFTTNNKIFTFDTEIKNNNESKNKHRSNHSMSIKHYGLTDGQLTDLIKKKQMKSGMDYMSSYDQVSYELESASQDGTLKTYLKECKIYRTEKSSLDEESELEKLARQKDDMEKESGIEITESKSKEDEETSNRRQEKLWFIVDSDIRIKNPKATEEQLIQTFEKLGAYERRFNAEVFAKSLNYDVDAILSTNIDAL